MNDNEMRAEWFKLAIIGLLIFLLISMMSNFESLFKHFGKSGYVITNENVRVECEFIGIGVNTVRCDEQYFSMGHLKTFGNK